jgi:REP element-mobilizing transposase RayT
MPWGLKRYQQSRQSHFVTYSCYRRLSYLTESLRDVFLSSLERTRTNYRFRVYGYVVMPEHVHLLVSEPDVEMLSKSIQGAEDFRRAPGRAGFTVLAEALLRSQCARLTPESSEARAL